VCFNVRAVDAAGCASELDPTQLAWTLEKAPGLAGSLNGACFRAGDSTAEAEGVFRVTVGYQGKHDRATVDVSIADLSDITAKRDQSAPNELGADDTAQGAGIAGAGVKAVQVGQRNWGPWLLGGAGLALGLGLLGWWLTRTRPAAAAARGAAPSAAVATPGHVASPAAPGAAVRGEPMICPRCRRGYAPGSLRCEADGSPLVQYAEFARQAQPTATRKCAGCGEALSPEAVFCGACGRRT
jgi:hypothetical protein